MTTKKKIVFLIIICGVGIGLYLWNNEVKRVNQAFEECASKYQTALSAPPTCWTPDGKAYTPHPGMARQVLLSFFFVLAKIGILK